MHGIVEKKCLNTFVCDNLNIFWHYNTHNRERCVQHTTSQNPPQRQAHTGPPRLRYFRAKSYAGAQGAGFRQRQKTYLHFVSVYQGAIARNGWIVCGVGSETAAKCCLASNDVLLLHHIHIVIHFHIMHANFIWTFGVMWCKKHLLWLDQKALVKPHVYL